MAVDTLPPSRRERASDATRSRVFGAALAEFRRVGFARAGVSRICREAGVSRPTFYFHFPTKEDVLRELQYSLQLGLSERLKRCRSLREAFAALVEGLLEAERAVGSAELVRDMLTIGVRGSAGASSEPEAFPALVELVRHFEEGAARGELRTGIDPERAPLLCLASVYGVQLAVPESERARDFEQLFSLYLAEEAA